MKLAGGEVASRTHLKYIMAGDKEHIVQMVVNPAFFYTELAEITVE